MGYPPLRPSGRNSTRCTYADTIIPADFPSYAGPFSAGSPYNLEGLAGLADMAAFNRPATLAQQSTLVAASIYYCAGGVLAPNGYIYGIPYGNTKILKIRLSNRSTSSITAGYNLYWGGVLAGDYIYCIPASGNKVMVINTTNDTLTYSSNTISNQCHGGVMSPQGAIYAMSSSSTQYGVLKIVPDGSGGGTFNTIASTIVSVGGLALALNGCIYAVPAVSTGKVYVWDPATDTLVNSVTTGVTGTWSGGVLAPNGKIYCAPTGGTSTQYILVITPTGSGAGASCSISTIAITGMLTNTWGGGALAPNGLIYFAHLAGSGSPGPLVVDPVAGTATMLPATLTPGYQGVVADSTGIYLIPNGTAILPGRIAQAFPFAPSNFLLSPCFNKY